jgi:hypothetical protein
LRFIDATAAYRSELEEFAEFLKQRAEFVPAFRPKRNQVLRGNAQWARARDVFAPLGNLAT